MRRIDAVRLLALAAAAVVMLFVARAEAEDTPCEPLQTVPKLECSYVASYSSVEFGAAGGTGTITITPTPEICEWDAITYYDWIDVSDTCS